MSTEFPASVTIKPAPQTRWLPPLAAGVVAVALVVLAIAVGSHAFVHFDPALIGYAIGSAIAAFAVAYRFTVWAQRPPSRRYFQRGLQLMFRRADGTPVPPLEEPAAPKPAGAWTADQVVDYLLAGIDKGDFYILCPDNDVSSELDRKRIQWAAGDLIEGRPALSRWHPGYAEAFAKFLAS